MKTAIELDVEPSQFMVDDKSAVRETAEAQSLRPAELRMPFASLPPPSGIEARKTSSIDARPRPPMQSSPELGLPDLGASMRPLGSGPARAPSVSIRPKNARTYCNRHKLARNHLGECMMCERTARQNAASLRWKIPLTLMLCAVALGAALAAYL